jgi:2'-5' RNA ligase
MHSSLGVGDFLARHPPQGWSGNAFAAGEYRRRVLIGFAALLPDHVQNFMRAAELELDERFGTATTIEPHVTFKQPFEGDVRRAGEYLDELAATTPPFELVLDGYATFESEGVLFLDVVRGAERVLALQRRVLDELAVEPDRYEDASYRAHATLAAGLTPEQLAEAERSLPASPRFQFEVDRLGLFARLEPGWIVHRRARLR